jgi:hypothetical protein
MTLKELQAWAQAQIDNTAQPEVRSDIGVSVLQLVEEVEELKAYITGLEAQMNVASKQAS